MATLPPHVVAVDTVVIGFASWLALYGARAEAGPLWSSGPTIRDWLLLLLITPVAAPTILLPYHTGAIGDAIFAILMVSAYWIPAMLFVKCALGSEYSKLLLST